MSDLEKLRGEFLSRLPTHVSSLVDERNIGPALEALRAEAPAMTFAENTEQQRAWECIGQYYFATKRVHDALVSHRAMYDHLLSAQEEAGVRAHKGTPLCWIADCYGMLGCPTLAKRYLLCTLIEDAISESGRVDPKNTGVYFRLRWQFGMPDREISKYAQEASQLGLKDSDLALYPESVLQRLDKEWLTEIPSAIEANIFDISIPYLRYLRAQLGRGDGVALERIAQYVMSAIPGVRAHSRARTHSTDLDVVCAVDGAALDFRSELGRYFICECKDWNSPVDFSALAKFCRVLDSAKCRFGVIFSGEGLSGSRGSKNATREQLKVFQDRGMVIIVIDDRDLMALEAGYNFVAMLRRKYEQVRLDLSRQLT